MVSARTQWEDAADATLAAVRPYASVNHALIRLPGPASRSGRHSDGLEGFARTFLAAGFRMVHAAPPVAEDLAEWYGRGIAAGVDPDGPERWPGVNEIHQARVEAASIALALYESRHVLWHRLDARVRQRVLDWFAPVVGQPYPGCNWVWFRAVVEAFLRWAGGPWSTVDIAETVRLTESWYVGDGWYTDGFGGPDGHAPASDTPAAVAGRAAKFDWYCGWAMHLYPLWYCRMSPPGECADLAERYRERLRMYLAGAQHLFAPDGAPLYQGRSLTYRFATVAPLWAGAIFDASPLPPGRTRALAGSVLEYFRRAGAWDAHGLQPLGWHGAFPLIRQPYSGAGSPYWSSKAFAGLVLPPDHPVWTDEEQRPELAERDVALTLPGPGWLVSGTRADGVVRVVNHGSDGWGSDVSTVDDPVYSRHGYSTHAGPDHGPGYDARESDAPGYDGQVALLDRTGAMAHRRPLYRVSLRDHVGVSRFRLGTGGCWVTTASVLRGAVEVRLARVRGTARGTPGGPWTMRIGGYCLAAGAPPAAQASGATASVATPDGLVSTVVGLRGLGRTEVVRSEGRNAFGAFAATPVACRDEPVEPDEVYAAAVVLGRAPFTLPRLEVTGASVRVVWPDAVDELSLDELSLSG